MSDFKGRHFGGEVVLWAAVLAKPTKTATVTAARYG